MNHHYADAERVKDVGNKLTKYIVEKVDKHSSASEWTGAVHSAFAKLLEGSNWRLLPPEGPYKGEYLCDFTVHEDGYGCRIACESQWMNWRREHRGELAWAFDKLRGVKADLKIFVFEGDEDDWSGIIQEYLGEFAQFTEGEAYLALQWDGKQFRKTYWIASRNGKQEEVGFQLFDSAPQTMSAYVADVYGNNAAITCPACSNAYILSKLLNQKNGRQCPHCDRSRATFEVDGVRVEKFNPVPVVTDTEERELSIQP